MAKFMLIRIGLMAEITDAGALREAALKQFDATDMTSDDHPDTADWHASEEAQATAAPHPPTARHCPYDDELAATDSNRDSNGNSQRLTTPGDDSAQHSHDRQRLGIRHA